MKSNKRYAIAIPAHCFSGGNEPSHAWIEDRPECLRDLIHTVQAVYGEVPPTARLWETKGAASAWLARRFEVRNEGAKIVQVDNPKPLHIVDYLIGQEETIVTQRSFHRIKNRREKAQKMRQRALEAKNAEKKKRSAKKAAKRKENGRR